jgi:DNA-directed RNA polymerase sigma subunit (sigma70/sigma32)
MKARELTEEEVDEVVSWGGASQYEIAKIMGVSRARVKQIEKRALNKIRAFRCLVQKANGRWVERGEDQ